VIYETTVLERHRQETIHEWKLHSAWVVSWLYKGGPTVTYPCLPCYFQRRGTDPLQLVGLRTT
jgi:hypothetical protein